MTTLPDKVQWRDWAADSACGRSLIAALVQKHEDALRAMLGAGDVDTLRSAQCRALASRDTLNLICANTQWTLHELCAAAGLPAGRTVEKREESAQ